MSTNIYNSIKTEYEKRQKQAFDNMMVRRNNVYSEIPRIQEIDSEIQLSGIKYNMKILMGNGSADQVINELVTKIDALKSEKENLLIKHGYPKNYMEISYKCSQCKDTGFIQDNLGRAEKCTCYKQQLLNHLYSQANLKLAETENFSTFNQAYYPDSIDQKRYGMPISPRKNILNIKDSCQKFIVNYNLLEEKNLFFCGPTGVGKTFMANCIAMELIKKGVTVLYQTATSLFNTINEYRIKAFKDEGFEDFSYKNIMEVGLLIIDDLGTESPTAARYAELLTILNTRINNNLSKPCKTIISTNIEVKDLHKFYDERIVSRIIGCFDLYKFAGEDIRSIKR